MARKPTPPNAKQEMDEKGAVIGGAVAGCLAPLSNLAVKAFDGNSHMALSDIPWVQMLVFAVIGATVVYFMAERVRRHVFVYGLAGPFFVLGVINSQRASKSGAEAEELGADKGTLFEANQAQEKAIQDLLLENARLATDPSAGLGAEAIEAVIESSEPAI